jgi:hypothetical protein
LLKVWGTASLLKSHIVNAKAAVIDADHTRSRQCAGCGRPTSTYSADQQM